MRLFILAFFYGIFTLFPAYANAASEVIGFRIHDDPNYSRFVLETSQSTHYTVATLNNPPRITIDLTTSQWLETVSTVTRSSFISKLRYGTHDADTLRIVLDMVRPSQISRHFSLPKEEARPHRIVVDIIDQPVAVLSQLFEENTPVLPVMRPSTDTIPTPRLKKIAQRFIKPTIILDPGHGGKDPGAIGRRRTYEKKLTLSYALALKDALLKTGRYQVYTTRDNDRFISLQQRVKFAQAKRGDLFISLHADSHNNQRVEGTSVYTLSETASDREAAALARKENTASFISTESHHHTSDVNWLLINLVQRDTKNMSSYFAETLTQTLNGHTRLLRNPHRFAGFRVLTAPDIPSVLIELGYLSNRREEKVLNSSSHKKKLVKLFVQAIDTHFRKYPVKR